MKKDGRYNQKDINFKIAEIFYEMAEILELKNVVWKPQA